MSNDDQKEKWEKAFGAWVNKGYQTFEIQEEYGHEIASCRDAYFHACEHQQKEIDRLKKQVEIAREDLEYLRKDFKGQYSSAETFYYTFIGKTLEKLKELE